MSKIFGKSEMNSPAMSVLKDTPLKPAQIQASRYKKEQKDKKDEQIQERKLLLNDYYITNNLNRNIMHLQCIKQNYATIEKLLQGYQKILEQATNQFYIQRPKTLKEYINLEDKFQNTPLLMSCLYNYYNSLTERHQCIQLLINNGAEINQRNIRTLWSALHWCAYYGDPKSVKILLENGCHSCFPDWVGNYPIDLASNSLQNSYQNSKLIVTLLVDELIYQISRIEYYLIKERNNDLQLEFPDAEKFIHDQIEYQKHNRRKYLLSPIIKSRIIFWSAYYKLDIKTIKSVCKLSNCIIVYPMVHKELMTSLHAAVLGNYDNQSMKILEFFISQITSFIKKKQTKNVDLNLFQKKKKFTFQNNDTLFLFEEEQKMFKSDFLKEIKRFERWQQKILSVNQYNTISDYLNIQDLYGNTSLHLAFINGNLQGAEVLLSNGAFIGKENKEGWQARELIQFNEVDKEYEEKIIEIEKKNNKRFQQMEKDLTRVFEKLKTTRVRIENQNQLATQLYDFANEISVPDYVIIFSTEVQVSSGQDYYTQKDAIMNRINFQINLLKNSDFQVFLMESIYPNKLYVMLYMEEDKLRKACQENKMLIKKIDSYDYEVYNIEQKNKFEPFRSKQRQEIIELCLQKIMNLKDLVDQKIVYSHYKMHKYGGIAKIKDKWIESTKWYLPQPLNQMDDYLLEGKAQNFTSITLIRQYFGEKIAFFFGWKSFTTCFMVFIAIPGLAIQIYSFVMDNYDSEVVPFWVIYVMIWGTFIIEFWKRKTSEINYRWGTLDEMNNPDSVIKQIRNDFIGDECISDITGELTKHQDKTMTVLVFIISIPILIVLVGCIVLIVWGVQIFKKIEKSSTNDIIAGVLQGIGIQILNIVYTIIATFFASRENHKYEESYERSLIYKLVIFKFVNSYCSLFYVCFFEQTNLYSVFLMLLPIMLIKQVNYMFLSIIIPKIIIKMNEKDYFNKMQQEIKFKEYLNFSKAQNDPIEEYWFKHTGKPMKSYYRSVIHLQKDEDMKNNKNAKIKKKIDADSVELNSVRINFFGTINYYADSFIDLGYITLFAAAFPIGPIIALLMNTLEIRNKIIVFLDVFKRPTSERCTGLNDWIYIWEAMFFLSIFSNIGLLYKLYDAKYYIYLIARTNTLSDPDLEQYKQWIYLGLAAIIFGVKMLLQYIIKDKPSWILSEEKKLNYIKSEKKKNADSQQSQEQQQIQDSIETTQADIKKVEENQLLKEKQQKLKVQLILQKITFFKKYSKLTLMPFEKERTSKQDQENQLQKSNQYIEKKALGSQYYLQLIQVLKNTYIHIERRLLLCKLMQMQQFCSVPVVMCTDCNKKLACFYCIKCQISFCQNCFDSSHENSKLDQHKIYIYKEEPENTIKFLMNYKLASNYQKENSSKIAYNTLIMKNDQSQQQKKTNAYALKIDDWKKMDDFMIYTNDQGTYFKYLQKMFELFYEEYIRSNGINVKQPQLSSKKVLNIQSQDDDPSIFTFGFNRSFYNIIFYDAFGIEDKIFLNRLAFLAFKRFANNCTFQDFHTLCKFMQDGYLQQKISLLLDFLDEDEEKNIQHQQFRYIFSQSLLQNTIQQDLLDRYITKLFQGETQTNKKRLAKQLIDEGSHNKQIIQFISKLFQQNKKQ